MHENSLMAPNRAGFSANVPARPERWRIILAGALALSLMWMGMGCSRGANGAGPGVSRVIGPHHTLEEIGEIAFLDGERAETRGQWRDAFDAYARAEWAFEYHRRLTGREPDLLAQARAGADRAARRAADAR